MTNLNEKKYSGAILSPNDWDLSGLLNFHLSHQLDLSIKFLINNRYLSKSLYSESQSQSLYTATNDDDKIKGEPFFN